MSLAVTARIAPCKSLFYGMALVCCAVFMLGLAWLMSSYTPHWPATVRILAGCVAIVAAIYGISVLYAQYHVAWVQIDPEGHILLALTPAGRASTSFPLMKAQTAHLLPGSTLLPYVMLWQLRCETGACVSVPVFPGSVSPDVFRALSLASHQIAGTPPFR